MLLKVAIIEPVGGHGGMDYYDFGLCEGLASSDVDVVLHTCDETEINQEQLFKVRHTYTGIYGDAPSWVRGIRYILGSIKAFTSMILEGRKVAHFHFFHVGPRVLMNVLMARLAMRRVVITAHDVESFVSSLEVPFMSRLAYGLAHHVIAHNQLSYDEVIRHLKVRPKKVSVIPSGNYLHIVGNPMATGEARKKLNVSTRSKILLFFGQIKDVKRLDLLLEAMPAIVKHCPDTLLIIAGKPWKASFDKYQSQIDNLGINDYCLSHIRFIPDEEMPYYYLAADLVVLPYERIYQSAVVLMAMSYGKAVLVSDLPSMLEMIEDGSNGYVFTSNDVKDLSAKVIEALSNDSERELIASRGLECMKTEYDWADIGRKTMNLYKNTL
jgi:glycosyltransferase involved in cell wall biosynthesis